VVYDSGSVVASSAAIIGVTNPAPLIVLSAPTNGASFLAPATISLAASVVTNGHSIARVQFYNGSTLLVEDSSVPYTFSWTNVSAGTYSITAKVVYDAGSAAASSSSAVSVTNPTPMKVGSLTAPWQTADIGNVGLPGTVLVSNGTYYVSGNGNLQGTSDSFRFLYQPATSNCTVVAQINAAQFASDQGCVGIMMRENLTTGSSFAMIGISPGGPGVWVTRNGSLTVASKVYSTAAHMPPDCSLMLVRNQDMLSGFVSVNGSWSMIGNTTIPMAANAYVGLAVASGTTNSMASATFTNITVSP
jgi:hypothetical protein